MAVEHAADAPIARVVAVQAPAAVRIAQAAAAGARGLVADAGCAVAVFGALDAAIAQPVAPLARRTVLAADAAHALPLGAPPARTIAIGDAGRADPSIHRTPPTRAVGIRQARHAVAVRRAVASGAAAIVLALHATALSAADLAWTLGVITAGHTPAVGAAHLRGHAGRIIATLHTNLVDADRATGALGVLHAALAAPFDAAGHPAAVPVHPAGLASPRHAHPTRALRVFEALDALTIGGTAALATICIGGARRAAARTIQAATPVGAVGISKAGHTGARLHVAVPGGALGVYKAAHAQALFPSADTPAEAVPVRGTLDADVAQRLTHGTIGALGAPAALHTAPRTGLAHAFGAVAVRLAVHTLALGQKTMSAGAVGVLAALGALPARAAAAPFATVLVAATLHAPAARQVAGACRTVAIHHTLAAEPGGLAVGGWRTGGRRRVAAGHAGAPQRVTELAGLALYAGAGGAIATRGVGGRALAVEADEAFRTGALRTAGGAAEAPVGELKAAITTPPALRIRLAGRAGRQAQGAALPRFGAVVGGGAGCPAAAVRGPWAAHTIHTLLVGHTLGVLAARAARLGAAPALEAAAACAVHVVATAAARVALPTARIHRGRLALPSAPGQQHHDRQAPP